MNTTQLNTNLPGQPITYAAGQPTQYTGQQYFNNRPGAAYGSVPQPINPGQYGQYGQNDAFMAKLDRGQATLHALEGRAPDPATKQVVQDLERIVQDNKELLTIVNSGNTGQNIGRRGWGLIREMQGNEGLSSLFKNWRGIASSAAGSSDLDTLMNMGGGFLSSIRDTQEFFELMAELVALLKTGLGEASTQFAGQTGQTGNTSSTSGLGSTAPQFSNPAPSYNQTQNPAQVLPNTGSSNVSSGRDLANAASHAAGSVQQSAQSGQINDQVHRVTAEIKKILTLLAYNPTYHRIVEHGRYAASETQNTANAHQGEALNAKNQFVQSENLHAFTDELEHALQNIAGDQADVGLLFEATKLSLQDLVHNQRLQSVLHELKTIADTSADNPAMLTTPAAEKMFKEMGNELQQVLHELRDDENVIVAQEESSKLISAIASHPVTNRLVTDFKQLAHDLGGEEGQILDPQILNSIRQIIVPVILDQLNNVPLPPTAGEAKMLGRTQYELSNMMISVPALIPDNIYVRFEHEMNASVQHMSASQHRTFVEIFARDVQVHMQNIHFVYHRMTIPKTSDQGLMSVDTRGRGVSIRLRLEVVNDLQNNRFLNYVSSNTTIDSLAIRFHQSKHDRMYTRLSDTFSGRIKKQITRAVDSKVPMFAQKVNTQLIPILMQAQEKTGGLKGLSNTLMHKGMNALHGSGEGGAQGLAKVGAVGGKQAVSGLQKLEDKLRATAGTKESIAHVDSQGAGVPAVPSTIQPVAPLMNTEFSNMPPPQSFFDPLLKAPVVNPVAVQSGGAPEIARNVHYETRPLSNDISTPAYPQTQPAVISSTPLPATYDDNYGPKPGVYTMGPNGERVYAGPLPDQYKQYDQSAALSSSLGQASLN